jgi:WD40 repeat protein
LAGAAAGQERPATPAKQPPADRYGDPLPRGAIARLGTLRLRQATDIAALAFSPDGNWLISAGPSGQPAFWAVHDDLRGSDGTPRGLEWAACLGRGKAVSPDGQTAAVGLLNGPIEVRSRRTGHVVHELRGHHGRVEAIAFAPDGQSLLAASLAFRPPGQRGLIHEFILWDAKTGAELRRLPGTDQADNRLDGRHGVAFAPDGRLVATTSTDGTARLWDMRTGKELFRLSERGGTEAVAFSPDGAFVTWAEFNAVSVLDLKTRKVVRVLRGPVQAVLALAFSPDGKTLAAGGADRVIWLWDLASGKPSDAPAGHRAAVTRVVFSPDGRRVASAGQDGTVRLWEATTGKQVAALPDVPRWTRIAFRPDGKALAVAGRPADEVAVWDLAADRKVPWPDRRKVFGYELAFAPDGRTLATSTGQMELALWDVVHAEVVQHLTTHRPIRCHVFSPNGRWLASGGDDGVVRLWDVRTGKEDKHFGPRGLGSVLDLAFSADGALLAVADGHSLRLLEVAGGRERWQLRARGDWYDQVTLSADGRLAATGAADGAVVLVAVATGKEWRRLRGHRGAVVTVAFAPRGRRLVSAGEDTTALVWDLVGDAVPDR